MLLLLCVHALSGIFGTPRKDRVVADHYDVIKVIETLPTPKNVKHIREAGYTTAINDEDYPWPGHKYNTNLDYSLIHTETAKIFENFCGKIDVTQDTLYYHPAGPQQLLGTWEQVNNAPRVKVNMTLDPQFGVNHFTGLYMPPGELITIEIPEKAVNKFNIQINQHVRDAGTLNERLPKMRCEPVSKLSKQVNTIGWPYGGSLFIGMDPDFLDGPVEITISGGIRAPWYRYGVDTEEEWKERRNDPGLMGVIETGNMQFVAPASLMRHTDYLDDACRFWRSCAEVMEAIVEKKVPNWQYQRERENGRERVPHYFWFDSYVPVGAAVAFQGSNFCLLPNSWFNGVVTAESFLQGGWGSLHELGHHHQEGWGIGSNNQKGEVTNNVLVCICYALYTRETEKRKDNGNCDLSKPFLHPYFIIESGSDWLCQYVSLMHGFGVDKMREFIVADKKNLYYDKSVYGENSAYLLRAAKIFGYDIRAHMDLFGFTYTQEAVAELEAMNLKPWYPVTNVYLTGYEVDGKIFETSRPFVVKAGEKHVFDFKTYTKSREGHGSFTMTELRGRDGAWQLIEEGKYEYTPLDDILAIDEFRVVYKEETTGQVTVGYGRIKQSVMGSVVERYNIAAGERNGLDIVGVYQLTATKTPDRTYEHAGMSVQTETLEDRGHYVSVCKGIFSPPETGAYTFYANPDDQALLYLSESPLSFNAETDQSYLILRDDSGYRGSYSENYRSEPQQLTKGKDYYFAFVIYNTGGQGGGHIGYKFNGGSITGVNPMHVLRLGTGSEIQERLKFIPSEWEEIRSLDCYAGPKLVVDKSGWTVESAPQDADGHPASSLISSDTSDTFITIWNEDLPTVGPGNGEKWPHVFVIDFGKSTTFNMICIENPIVSGRNLPMVNSVIEFKCDDNVILEGTWNSATPSPFVLDSPVTGRKLTITVKNNNCLWYGHHGRTAFGSVSVGMSFTAAKVIPAPLGMKSHWWSPVKYGAYYNGAGMKGTTDSSVSFEFPAGNSEIVILGDKSADGGVVSVLLDDTELGEFDSHLTEYDLSPLSPRLYKQPLFVIRISDTSKAHIITLTVKSGDFTFAGFLATDSDQEIKLFVKPEPEPQPKPEPEPGQGNMGVIIGASVGSLAGVAIIAAAALVYIRKCQHKEESSDVDVRRLTDHEIAEV